MKMKYTTFFSNEVDDIFKMGSPIWFLLKENVNF